MLTLNQFLKIFKLIEHNIIKPKKLQLLRGYNCEIK